ncbi:MAG: tetratricopeptide repeat protein [Saprospiraceae bacterium]|nr:tetratricopeptide repeat protein [Saprospiraceae bacterium]
MFKGSLFILALVLFGCQSSPDVESQISDLETQLSQAPNQEVLKNLLGLYEQAHRNSKESEQKLEYLWKTGETARALRDYTKAESAFSEIYDKFPEADQASKALFMHAFMMDEDLKAFDKAKGLYESFLTKYPDSDFTDDAQFLLQHLGKTDEEMLEFLQQQSQEQGGEQ